MLLILGCSKSNRTPAVTPGKRVTVYVISSGFNDYIDGNATGIQTMRQSKMRTTGALTPLLCLEMPDKWPGPHRRRSPDSCKLHPIRCNTLVLSFPSSPDDSAKKRLAGKQRIQEYDEESYVNCLRMLHDLMCSSDSGHVLSSAELTSKLANAKKNRESKCD